MSGNSLVVDTNIILYLLAGDETVLNLLDQKSVYISFITELELFGFKELSITQEKAIINFISETTILDVNTEIKKSVIQLRKSYKIKLPDAIVASTALFLNLPLLTADKQLNQISELNILQYEK